MDEQQSPRPAGRVSRLSEIRRRRKRRRQLTVLAAMLLVAAILSRGRAFRCTPVCGRRCRCSR